MKHKIVTMVGSMKFYQTMLDEETRLTDMGYIVMHPVKSGFDDISKDLMRQYDSEIRAKIDMSDVVYAIDVEGYLGESTCKEIQYAQEKNIEVIYYSKNSNLFCQLIDDDKMELIIGNLDKCGMRCVTLIGSYRFAGWARDICKVLSLRGMTVYTPAIFQFTKSEIESFSELQHEMFDKLHFRKIIESDAVLVLDGKPGDKSYIGEDTNVELEFATRLMKPIYCLTDINCINNVVKGMLTNVNGQVGMDPM